MADGTTSRAPLERLASWLCWVLLPPTTKVCQGLAGRPPRTTSMLPAEPRSLSLTVVLAFSLLSCGSGRIDLFGTGPIDASADDVFAMAPGQAEAATDDGCASDTDCKTAGAHRCDLALHVCVECVGDSDCAGRNDSKCNQVTHACELPCTSTAACLGSDVCDTNQMACADCLVDSTCDKTEPHCVSENCICLADSECGSDKRCLAGDCVACVTTADCPMGKMCTANHDCE